MALHRDIYWVGRQWAVTGFGVQAVDQRLKGAFDIEVAHLWDDDLPQRMRALAWLKADDFDKALDIARARHPEPPRKSLPLVESILEMIPPGGRGEVLKPPASSIEASLLASEPKNLPLAHNEAGAPASDAPKPSVAPITAGAPASRPSTRTVMGSKPAPPPATPPPSKPKPLVAAPIEASVRASKPAAIEPPPAKFQPLALRIEHASAKFLPRWRVRH
jgi:hypothetical protein